MAISDFELRFHCRNGLTSDSFLGVRCREIGFVLVQVGAGNQAGREETRWYENGEALRNHAGFGKSAFEKANQRRLIKSGVSNRVLVLRIAKLLICFSEPAFETKQHRILDGNRWVRT